MKMTPIKLSSKYIIPYSIFINMDTLNDDCKNTIFKYIHQMKFRATINYLNKSADMWCEQQLIFRYCKARHIYAYNKCINEFKI